MNGHIHFQTEFEYICNKEKDKTAITYYRKHGRVIQCSYNEMLKYVTDIADEYANQGIKPGDRVAVLIPLCMNLYLDILALAYLGATSVVLDANLHQSELLRIIDDADVSCIIASRKIYDDKLTCLSKTILDADNVSDCFDKDEIVHPQDADLEAIAILYSSGTTSQAKGIVIHYEQELLAFDCLFNTIGGSDKVSYLMLFPCSHISGFTCSLVLLMKGGSIATMENASAIDLVNGFQLFRPNVFGMVPKVWDTFKSKIEESIKEKGKQKSDFIFGLMNFCGAVRNATGINLGRTVFKSINDEVFGGDLRQVHLGGGQSSPELKRFYWNLGFDCYDFYASTECNVPILVASGKAATKGMGIVTSNPNAELRIWNPDCNGIGEIQVKSKTIMKEYFRNPELTKESFNNEFFKTGDYGKICKNNLYITGRIKESIHLATGEKISPDDIESAYRSLLKENIEFAVVGINEEESYEQVYVFLVGKQGIYDEQFKQVNRQMSQNYKYKKLVYIDELPKTSVGKVKRYYLKQKYESKKLIESTVVQNIPQSDNIDEWIIELVKNHSTADTFSDNMKLQSDLGIDSLNIFEICVEIDAKYNISIENSLTRDFSTQELIELVQYFQIS